MKYTVVHKSNAQDVIHAESPKEECNMDDVTVKVKLGIRLVLARGYSLNNLCLHCFPLMEEGEE
jgi:hypothetical protein